MLWQFRRANRLATIQWQATKDGFNEKILKMEELAVSGIPQTSVPATVLNAYTKFIYDQAVAVWKEMEGEYWVKFWAGF